MPTNPHLAFPLSLTAAGGIAVVEQDELPEVQGCVALLRFTPLGARMLAPDVGLPDPTFTSGVDPADLERRLTDEETGEPRASVQVNASPVDAHGRQNITIKVGLAADAAIPGSPA